MTALQKKAHHSLEEYRSDTIMLLAPFPFSNNHVHATVLEYMRTFPRSNNADGHNGSVPNGQAYGVSSPLQEHFSSHTFGSLSINAFGGANHYGCIANSWVSASYNSIYCSSFFQYSFSSR